MKVVTVRVPIPIPIPTVDYKIVSIHSTTMILDLDRLPSDYSMVMMILTMKVVTMSMIFPLVPSPEVSMIIMMDPSMVAIAMRVVPVLSIIMLMTMSLYPSPGIELMLVLIVSEPTWQYRN